MKHLDYTYIVDDSEGSWNPPMMFLQDGTTLRNKRPTYRTVGLGVLPLRDGVDGYAIFSEDDDAYHEKDLVLSQAELNALRVLLAHCTTMFRVDRRGRARPISRKRILLGRHGGEGFHVAFERYDGDNYRAHITMRDRHIYGASAILLFQLGDMLEKMSNDLSRKKMKRGRR